MADATAAEDFETKEVITTTTTRVIVTKGQDNGRGKLSHIHLLICMFLGLATRLYKLSQPREVVFDEVHFGGFINNYFKHEYFFDIHPPLGKLLLYVGAKFFGYNDNGSALCQFGTISNQLESCCHICVRLLPAITGSFLVPLAYLLTWFLGGTKAACILSASLILFDNAFVTQNRFVWMESFLFFFVMTSSVLSIYLKRNFARRLENVPKAKKAVSAKMNESAVDTTKTSSKKGVATANSNASVKRENDESTDLSALAQGGSITHTTVTKTTNGCVTENYQIARASLNSPLIGPIDSHVIGLFFLGLSMCLLFSVKWMPGAAMYLGVFLHQIVFPMFKLKTWTKRWKYLEDNFFLFFVVFLLIPFILYASIYKIHFDTLSKTGPGDVFHTREFRAHLAGSADSKDASVEPASFFSRFIELNVQHYKMQFTTGSHPYASSWFGWPLGKKVIWYWQGKEFKNGLVGRIYLTSNPIIWVSSALGVAATLGVIVYRFFVLRKPFEDPKREEILFSQIDCLVMYGINWLPYFLIGRTTFLYHYMPALIFALQNLALLFDFFTLPTTKQFRRTTLIVFIGFAVVFFNMIAPLSYGLPVNPNEPKWQFFTS